MQGQDRAHDRALDRDRDRDGDHSHNRALDCGRDRDRFRDRTPNMNRRREKQPVIEDEVMDVDGENPQVRGNRDRVFGSPLGKNNDRLDPRDGRTATPSIEEELLRNRLNEVEKENTLLRLERENQSRPRTGNLNNHNGRSVWQRLGSRVNPHAADRNIEVIDLDRSEKNLLVTGDLLKRRRVRPRQARTRPAAAQQSAARTTTHSKHLRNDKDEVRDRHDERESSPDYYGRSDQGRAGREPTGPQRKRMRSKSHIPEDQDYEQEDSSSDGDVDAITEARLCKMTDKVMSKKLSREEKMDRFHRAAGDPFKLNI
ncbi:serine/threonine-protein kinase prpf4B-like [Papaver somniferum]|uniref:serine/threonine-protein kinase prpf4B-like n=1 Tax=Papaver somniferum TaxID=3469 RepID=UPI000E704487|nr:serine/threonine-protein kinase prpf4B-like [Papaver somniferum]